MTLAALYDVHGNLPALEAALAEVRRAGVDRIVIGGDVLPGPMPRETLETLLAIRDIPVSFLRGNGEAAVLAEAAGAEPGVPEAHREALRWTAGEVLPNFEAVLRGWPATLRRVVAGAGEVLFCHATPRNDTEIFTATTPEGALLPLFEPLGVDLVVCGHTHMPFDRRIGSTRVVNAGSIGMPFGEPGAFWLLLGEGVELRRTAYDRAAAAERIRATRYPGAEGFARGNVLTCPGAAEMLAAFSEAEIR